ncbi:MAG: phospholipase D-like domain-containing protein [Anaerolineales bacterium]|jgi:phosphatidylserine/phosphatidylglycerophosphate/cardiolipin synthase-like enzyme
MRESIFLRSISRHRYTLIALFILALLIGLGWLFSVGSDGSTQMIMETPAATDWIEVLFTNPDAPEAGRYRGGPDEALAAAIDQARFSVDVAALDLDLWSIRDALIAAHQRGVSVRVVVESDNFEVDEIQDLIAAGIDVVQDRRPSLMHHKFIVIDRAQVWTGSMNFTVNGAYRNNNNLVHIQSLYVARSYAREFEEMFIDDRFGALSLLDTPYPVIQVGDSRIEVLFSPDDGVMDRVVDLVAQAQDEIVIMAFALTSDPLAETLLERSAAGVHVTGVVESGQAGNAGSDVDRLQEAGIELYLDGNPANMHHKVIILDGSIVITGSYNFSRNAEEFNDENLIILYDPSLASRFLLEWERVLAQAVP